ncbi:MAG: hypothetical protein NUV88_02870 [Candidatus Kaiserbacteria bacterium]|nr:hypothetical protein [Candidatus Kaiserbacteria bacterium]
MDETNPTDTTAANPATGSNPAPAQIGAPAPSPSANILLVPPVVGKVSDEKAMHDDIARILEEVKLPERREFETSADASRKKADEEKAAALKSAPVQPAPEKVARPESTADQKTETKKEEELLITPIHTLKDDLQSAVRNTKMSLVHAVALEEEKRRRQEKMDVGGQKEKPRNVAGIVLGIFVLIVLVAGGTYSVYSIKQKTAPASGALQDTPLFFSDKTVPFSLESSSGTDLKRTLAQALNAPKSSLGAIMRIMPVVVGTDASGAQTQRVATIEEFLKAIAAQTPPDLIRAFQGNFLLGIHTHTSKNTAILVIPVSSYERAFAGMLAWEAGLNEGLAPIFTPVPPLTVDAGGLLVNRKFEDSVAENFNVRVLKDDSGEVKMMYSFPTRNILVIVENPEAFTEVLGRLRAARQL